MTNETPTPANNAGTPLEDHAAPPLDEHAAPPLDEHAAPPLEPATAYETTEPPEIPPAPEPFYPPQPLQAEKRASSAPLLLAVLVLALIVLGGGYYLWTTTNGAGQQVAALQSQLDTLQQRLQAVEARPLPQPPPPPPNLQPLEQRLTALENKPPPPVPAAPLDTEGRTQLAALSGRIDSVTARDDQIGTQEQMDAGKLTAQEQADIAKLSAQEQTDISKLSGQIAGLDTRVTAATKADSQIESLASKQALIERLQSAAVALQAGRPLGDIPGAPPALAQFATKPPPTDASLRLSFDQAAAKAHLAGQPPADETPFLNRVWDKAQSLVTVREGDRVLVGDAVSGVLEHSRHLLDAGDVAGAVTALNGLAGPAAEAMAPWRAQAQSLLDARAAMITTAHS